MLDRKPSARETGIVGTSIKSGTTINVACSTAAGKDTIPKEAAFSVTSSSSLSSSLPSKQSNAAIKNNKHTMVSGGPGRSQQHGRHGNSRQGEEEEQHHLLNWQYTNRNNAHDESAEIIVQPAIGFDEGPLENDPASARGDVSSASPERGIETETDTENHYNGNSSSSAVRLLDGSFVLGRREESPLVLPTAQSAAATSTSTSTSTIRNSYDRGRTASSAPMIAATLPISRRDMSRISPAAGSERGTTYSLQAKSKSWGNGKKKASSVSTAEEARFRHILKKERGLEIREQDGDGNCLFRAISLQVYGDPSMHGDVRKQCMDHMERDQEHFSQFVTGEPFLHYVARTRQDGVHGNNPEIQASSELFNRPIEVFTPENGSSPLNIFHAEYKTGDVPIRLSYHDGNHYNAVIDPLMPTAGLGLGLPGLKPGYADKMQMAKAVAESMNAAADQDQTELQQVLKASQVDFNTTTESDDELQRAIKESQLSAEHMSSNNALSLSDMDATYFELEQAALERSLRSYSQKDEGKKQSASSTKTKLTTAKSRPSTGDSSKPKTIKGDHKTPAVAAAAVAVATSATTSLPCPSQESIPLAAAAASSSVALAAARGRESSSSSPTPPQRLLPVEEYPSSVQELVMNGFPLSSVVKAFDLVGNNFDHMLSLCLSNANRSS